MYLKEVLVGLALAIHLSQGSGVVTRLGSPLIVREVPETRVTVRELPEIRVPERVRHHD